MSLDKIPPLPRFQTGLPLFLSPEALMKLFNCEFCLDATLNVGLYFNREEGIVLCDRCSKPNEATLVEFLAYERPREWLEEQMRARRNSKIVDIKNAKARR